MTNLGKLDSGRRQPDTRGKRNETLALQKIRPYIPPAQRRVERRARINEMEAALGLPLTVWPEDEA